MTKENADITKEMIETIEKGILDTMNSEKYKEFLKVQSMFHNYSYNNTMLIFLQKPEATAVAGYKTWQKLERQVQKGEKGINILAPAPYKFKVEVNKIDPETKKPIIDPQTNEPIKETKTVEGLNFRKVSVFDISQTEGKELPSLAVEIKTNSKNAEMVINGIKEISDTPIFFEDYKERSKGYFSPSENKIVIKDGMSLDQTAKTLVHEYTHSQLHKQGYLNIDRATAEIQAESVAFIVSNRYGIDTSEYSFNYLASWSSGKDLKELKNSMDIIQKASNIIIEKLDSILEKELKLQKEQIDSLDKINTKDKIIEQYKNEFPAIKHISDKGAKAIDSLNQEQGKALSVDEIKKEYKKLGHKLEKENNQINKNEFNNIQDIVNDLNKAQLNLKEEQAKNKVITLQKEKAFEMI